MKLCSVPGCGGKHCARGLCNTHYAWWRRRGLPGRAEWSARETGTGCSVPGCGRNHYGRGLCALHYKRWKRHGDPQAPGRPAARDFLDQVIARRDHGDECLPWPFASTPSGHGDVRFQGRAQRVSHVVCLAVYGPPPAGKPDAAHTCGNATCCNPRHIRWASRAENQRDRLQHGTHCRGARHWNSKLTEPQVREIQALKGQVSALEAGQRYGVAATTVKGIWSGKAWGWLR